MPQHWLEKSYMAKKPVGDDVGTEVADEESKPANSNVSKVGGDSGNTVEARSLWGQTDEEHFGME